MSDVVVLSLRAGLDRPVDLEGITPDRVAAIGEREIAGLPVWVGSRTVPLGELFDVRGGQSSRMRLEGDLRRVTGIAAGTAGGEMLVEGSVGGRLAAGMAGGWVDVRGDAGDDAGVAMSGGALRIIGNAGDRLGGASGGAAQGMRGGEIVVNGSAGSGAGARLRRGLIVVTGDVGDDPGRAMIAGSIVSFGRTGAHPGRGSKRGSILALGPIDIPATYTYACTYQPPHVRLTLTYLRRRYGVQVDDEALTGRYRRYCGDASGVGKGEILELVRDTGRA